MRTARSRSPRAHARVRASGDGRKRAASLAAKRPPNQRCHPERAVPLIASARRAAFGKTTVITAASCIWEPVNRQWRHSASLTDHFYFVVPNLNDRVRLASLKDAVISSSAKNTSSPGCKFMESPPGSPLLGCDMPTHAHAQDSLQNKGVEQMGT